MQTRLARDRYRLHETADGWLCVAAVTDEHRRGDTLGRPSTDGTASTRRSAHPHRRRVVRGARWGRRAVRGADTGLRPLVLRRSRDDREGLGHVVPAPHRRRHGRRGAAVRPLRDARASSRARRSCPARTRARFSELGYDDERIDKLGAGRHRSSNGRHDVPSVIPPSPTRDDQFSGTPSPKVGWSSNAARRAAPCATLRRPCAVSATRSSGTRRSRRSRSRLHLDRVAPPDEARRRAPHRGPRRVGRGHPVRRQPPWHRCRRRRATAWKSR